MSSSQIWLRKIKWVLPGAILFLMSTTVFSQQLKLGGNPSEVKQSAVLELESNNQGLLFPRILDTTLINGLLDIPDGMVVFDSSTMRLLLRTGGFWRPLTISTALNNYWSVNGNAGTLPTSFLGTTDSMSIYFRTRNIRRLFVDSIGSVAIGTFPIFTGGVNREKLLVDAGGDITNPALSYNVISGKGYINNYLQLNIQNRSPGTIASSDLVATADNGDETINYVDLGINSSGNTANYFGSANDSYLYNLGQNFLIGTGTANKSLLFLTGGAVQSSSATVMNNERMRIDAIGVGIGTGTAVVGNRLEVKTATPTSATSGLRLNGLGTATPLAVTTKTLSVNANGDIIVTTLPTATVDWALAGNNITAPLTQFIGTTSVQPLTFKTQNIERMRLFPTVGNGGLAIGTATLNATNPEKLLVDAGITTSFNVISGKGNINNYLQLNIQNNSNAANASSDLVATADNGTEVINYVDLGINSSGNTANYFGSANDAYLYNLGEDFLIGTGTAGKHLAFLTGGGIKSTNERMRIDSLGKVGIGNIAPSEILDVSGNFRLSGAFMPGNNAGTAGYYLTSDGAGNSPTWNAFDTTSITAFSQKVRSLFSATAPITYVNGLFAITQATTSTDGYLTSADWNTFNAKLGSISSGNLTETGSSVLTVTGGTGAVLGTGTTLQVTQANGSQSGFLTSADWTTFNNKLATIDTINISNFYLKVRSLLSGGTGISYNNGTGIIVNTGVLSLNGNTGALTMDTGYISDFSSKVRSRLSVTAPIIYTNGLFGITQATTSADGYLSSTDWNTFNNKASTTNVWSLTGNSGTASGSNFIGTTGSQSFVMRTNGVQGILLDSLGNVGIGATPIFTGGASREKLLVDAGTTGSFNVISGKGSINNYLQLNIQNRSNGSNASSDLVATADNGDEFSNYVDLGINSSGNTSTYGAANDAYLYNVGQNFLIGAGTAGKSLAFYTGGGIQSSNERMRIDGNGRVGIGTSLPSTILHVSGANPLTLIGVATGTSTSADSLLTITSGLVRKLPVSSFLPSTNSWGILGNSGLSGTTNFLGTIDNAKVVFKSNNLPFQEFGLRSTLGLVQGYADYTDANEKVTYIRSALQFEAAGADFYKPKMYIDSLGNFRIKGSSAGTDYFEMGSTGTNNNGGFEFIIGDDGDEPMVFKSNHYLNGTSEIMRLQSGRMAIGSNAFSATYPEKLLIDAGTTSSYNLITGKGSINNYLQFNIKNQLAGTSASSDLVASADNGDETVNYIDLGINSSAYTNNTNPVLGGINNAYLYSTGNDFIIGNATAAKPLRFFTGGYALTNEAMRIDGSGNVGIGTISPSSKLHVYGTNPLTLTGVQIGTSTSADSLLTITGGVVRKIPVSSYVSAAITSLNGLTAATQAFATPGTAGTAPAWNSSVATHTLNIPMASTASVTAGLLSNTDWTTFNNKLSTIDTTNIANFYLKVRGLHTAGAGITYNNGTGAISNAGVLSVNGNIGALTMDTGYISNFYLKSRGLISAGTGIAYNNGTGIISTTSAAPSGAAGGDLTGTYPNPTLAIVNSNTGVFGSTTVVPQVTVNGKGLITAVSAQTIAFPVTSVNTLTGAVSLGLSNLNDATITTPATNQLLQYNGTRWVNATPSYISSAITSLNTLTAATQTFATPGITGTAPAWSSSVSTHTLNIPLASAAGVTAGLISKVEHTLFTDKVVTIAMPSTTLFASLNFTVPAGGAATGTLVLNSKTAKTFFAAPTGAAGVPDFRVIAPADLPVATTGALGVIQVGSGLAVTAGGILSATNTNAGTVTSVSTSVTQGVTASVTNATTTPNIAIGLGAITPTSVAATGTVTGANLSGTNTGDQTITLTGDVTGSGTGSFATTIGANLVTYPKFQQVVAARLLGNPTGALANVSEISLGTGLSFVGSVLTYTPATSGTVTSVGLALPSIFTVSGSPVTGSGTLTGTLATQTANLVFSGPASGGAATPTFRSLDAADFPASGVSAAVYGNNTGNSYPFITIDAKGRITSASSVAITASGLGAITSLNGLTGTAATTQTFGTPGTAGTAPAWSSATATHTLNIPLASAASVTAGLLSNIDWNTFNNKASMANVWSLTGNAGTISGTNFIGTVGPQSFVMRTNSVQGILLDSVGSVGIGATPLFASGVNREKLLVDAGTTGSFNVISGKGLINNYLQLNIQNKSAGTIASSDVVATADNGDETTNYVDMGINSSGNTSNYFGSPNDAYLYNLGQNFLIGTGSSAKSLVFLTGGGTQSSSASVMNNERMRINGSGNVGIGVNDPGNPLVVKDVMEIRRVGSLSQLIFSNTAASGDLRISGDGGDMFWQGGGSRALQMGAFHPIVLSGDRQTSTLPGFIGGSFYTNTNVLIPAQRTASVPLAIQAIASQTANLTEWRNPAGLALNVVNNIGNLGLGTSSPSAQLHVVGTNPLSLFGVQIGTSTSADSLLTITSGVVKKIPISTFSLPANSWNTTGNSGTVGQTNFLGTTDNNSLYLRANNILTMILDSLGNVGIGTAPVFTGGVNREKFLVDAGTNGANDFINVISGKGSTNNYLQVNIQNRSNGASASSDVVATNDIGTETVNFIDMGINSSANTNTVPNPILAGASNAYLYATGNDFLIGNASVKPLRFFTGGTAVANERMRITETGNVGIANLAPAEKLDITGNLKYSGTLIPGAGAAAGTFLTSTGPGSPAQWVIPTVALNTISWAILGNNGQNPSTHFLGTTDNVGIYMRTRNTHRLYIDTLGNVAIGTGASSTTPPAFAATPNLEKLLVDAGVTTSRNAIVGRGSIDSYLQLNIQNLSAGIAASSDVVATNNTGNETNLINFVDMGINSSGNTSTGVLGGANTGYLYNTGSDFVIGNSTTGRPLRFYTTGGGLSTDALIIDSSGDVGIGTTNPLYKLSVFGSNPLFLNGVQTGTNTDSLLTIINGIVKKVAPSTLPVANAWSLTGNATTNPSANFVGTTDNQALVLRVNNQPIARMEQTSVALGAGASTNTATNSLAMGNGASLGSGISNAMSMGNFASATIANTFAIGNNAISSPSNGGNSFAIGNSATVNSTNSFVVGPSASTASSIDYAFAIGNSAIVNGTNSLAIGRSATIGSNAASAISIGNTAQANSTGGVSIGLNASVGTTSANSMALGAGASIGAGLVSSTALGTNASTTLSNTIILGDRSNTSLSVGIGSEAFSPTTREKLLVDAGTVVSDGYISVIGAKGSTNNYLQQNTQNRSNGSLASTDIVATNDAGTELNLINFIDMGINSSGNTSTGVLGGNNTAYLYTTGSDFSIGNATSGKPLRFFTGGLLDANERMRIDGDGKVGIGTGLSTLLSDFTLIQKPSGVATSRGFRFSGTSIDGTNSGTGFVMSLGYNSVNNKQLWFGDPDYLGNAGAAFLRVSTSNGYSVLDGITGNNGSRRPLALGVGGDPNAGVTIGSDGNTAIPGSYVWLNGNMALGNGYRGNSAPSNGLIVQGNVGIATVSPNSTLSVNGSLTMAFRTVAGVLTTLTATDYAVINTTGGGVTWTLPAASTCPGRIYKLINHGGSAITLSLSVRTSGTTTSTSLGFVAGANFYEILSDGTEWRVMNN